MRVGKNRTQRAEFGIENWVWESNRQKRLDVFEIGSGSGLSCAGLRRERELQPRPPNAVKPDLSGMS
jgi:hypothetical protein